MLIFQNQLLNSSGTCGKFPSEYTFYSFGKNLTPLEKELLHYAMKRCMILGGSRKQPSSKNRVQES